MQALCRDGGYTLAEWIAEASQLPIEGLEWYAGFLEMKEETAWSGFREQVEARGLVIPMLCCSPDFTHPDLDFRGDQIRRQKEWIRMAAELGARYCRVLSGQRRPHLAREEGITYTVECIRACLPFAADHGVTLILENHYKDDFWNYPEFAQKSDIFCEIVSRLDHPNFGVNYDPSNTFLAGEDPLDLLRLVLNQVVTMHASDRYLSEGTIEDLRREETGAEGYAKRLRHGEIGQGLNDYDAIFGLLKSVGFGQPHRNNWISVEDGVDGFDQLERSVAFLRRKIAEYWPE
ncbi:MAG: sugar phosphate isomerase/epimerase [Akkermansiaceae bacterium]|nr:sugar phosphate isomerase/epimerase [Verrucomicrobiae bacterium]MCP5552122.1 sugar phosphate isomerase/epimerase [Akkermansiaceae bacterium]